jgi:hypothetical protein
MSCNIPLPASPSVQLLDPTKVQVSYDPFQGGDEVIPATNLATGCGSVNGGWYFDNPVNPTKHMRQLGWRYCRNYFWLPTDHRDNIVKPLTWNTLEVAQPHSNDGASIGLDGGVRADDEDDGANTS